MGLTRVTIAPTVTVMADEDMVEILELVQSQDEVYHQNLSLQQQALVATMTSKALLIKRRKNGKISYRIRPGISWQ
jgi:hypothetical protein